MISYSRYKFAFQHVNRCGGTSIKNTIKSLVGPPDKGSFPPSGSHKSMTRVINRLKAIYRMNSVGHVSIYVNIRDPFSRLVSIYSYRVKRHRRGYEEGGFKWFFYNIYMPIKSVASGPIKPMLVDKGERMPGNLTIVKIEDISTRWPGIMKKHFGLRPAGIPRRNISKHEDPFDYYDKEMTKLVIDRERWTLKRFYPELLRLV